MQELIEIIKNEKLYEYHPFQIGPPRSKDNIGAYVHTVDCEGIYAGENGIWYYYIEGERGNIKLAGKLHPESQAHRYPEEKAREYTEDEACRLLLDSMRSEKQSSQSRNQKKMGYFFMNKDKWW